MNVRISLNCIWKNLKQAPIQLIEEPLPLIEKEIGNMLLERQTRMGGRISLLTMITERI